MTVEGVLGKIADSVDRGAGALERIAVAAEFLVGRATDLSPSALEERVTFGELRDFADARLLGRGRGQGGPLWTVLTSDALATYLSRHRLPALRSGDDIDIVALKKVVGSEYFTIPRLRGCVKGLGEVRFDLLIQWVASL